MLSRFSMRWRWFDWVFVAVVVIVIVGAIRVVAPRFSCPRRRSTVDCERPIGTGATARPTVAGKAYPAHDTGTQLQDHRDVCMRVAGREIGNYSWSLFLCTRKRTLL
jgi:hypothetical protein